MSRYTRRGRLLADLNQADFEAMEERIEARELDRHLTEHYDDPEEER